MTANNMSCNGITIKPCDHVYGETLRNPYRGRNCGMLLCTDCGTTPVAPTYLEWRDRNADSGWFLKTGHMQYCRRCAEKAGYGYEFRATIDLEKLIAWFDGDDGQVAAFLKETSYR